MADDRKEETQVSFRSKMDDTGSWKLIVILAAPLVLLPLPLVVQKVVCGSKPSNGGSL